MFLRVFWFYSSISCSSSASDFQACLISFLSPSRTLSCPSPYATISSISLAKSSASSRTSTSKTSNVSNLSKNSRGFVLWHIPSCIDLQVLFAHLVAVLTLQCVGRSTPWTSVWPGMARPSKEETPPRALWKQKVQYVPLGLLPGKECRCHQV